MASPARTTPRLTAPKRREQLLGVTADIVVERGFHGLSIESVARRAGVTRAVIYQHFDDLDGLLKAVVEREMSHALAQVADTALEDLSHGNPRELMLKSLGSFLSVVQRHPTTWRFVLMPPQGAPEILRTSIARGRAAVLDGLAKAVRPALVPDDESGDPEMTANILSAVSDEYARLVLTDPGRYPPERLLRHARWWLSQTPFS